MPQYEWMTVIWGAETDGIPPFEDPLDVQWFASAVAARRDEIARDLDRSKLQPIFDVDERDGEVIWEYWIDGLGEAVALRPDAWEALADHPNSAAAWSRLAPLIAVARNESDLDSAEVNALEEHATTQLTEAVQLLYAARTRLAGASAPVASAAMPGKVGRNDPCPCGSGKKHKRCCD